VCPGRADHITSFLALCTGNICRSPMAEGILRRLFVEAPAVSISSAGTHALSGNRATEFAVIASFEKGIDISGHRARILNAGLIAASSIILCMEIPQVEWALSLDIGASGRVYNLAEFSGERNLKQIPDPYGCSLREFRQCFSDIERSILNFLDVHPVAGAQEK